MKKIDMDPTNYFTEHLYLAAFLVCSGHRVIGTTHTADRVSFVFQQTAELSASVAGFMSNAAIPARKFAFEVLKLKRLIPRNTQKMERLDSDGNNLPQSIKS
ncbi:MAG: hypothetical protein WA755_16665 [Candidatus Acidiferrales bacterium]